MMHTLLDNLSCEEHHYFPCRLFEQSDVKSFTVGPVKFLRSSDWLEEVQNRAGKKLEWRSILEEQNFKISGEEKNDYNYVKAREVSDALSETDWICSVSVSGREQSRSRECARIACTAAIAALGLGMSRRQYESFRGPGDFLGSTLVRTLSQRQNFDISFGLRVHRPEVGGSPGEHRSYVVSLEQLRNFSGTAIRCFTSLPDQLPKQRLSCRWIEALYWFHQSRREGAEFIALVKIGVSLDILTGGQKKNGITRLSSKLLGIESGAIINKNGHTLDKFITLIYNEGRSKIAHGNELAMLKELPIPLEAADKFCKDILFRYINAIAMYDGEDDYEGFLAAHQTA